MAEVWEIVIAQTWTAYHVPGAGNLSGTKLVKPLPSQSLQSNGAGGK